MHSRQPTEPAVAGAQPGGAAPGASQSGSGATPAKELRLHFTCIWCRQVLSVPLRSAGTTDTCPNCGARVPIPPLDDDIAGMELVRVPADPVPTAKTDEQLPPPPDEFEVAALEIRAFQQELQRRCELARWAVAADKATRTKPRGNAERRSQYTGRLLATMPAAAGRRLQWITAQLEPLLRRLAQLQAQTFRLDPLQVEIGAYQADAQQVPLKITAALGGKPTTILHRLPMSLEIARGWYAHWSNLSKVGTLAMGLGCRRVLRGLRITDTLTGEGFDISFGEVLADAPAAVTTIAFGPSGRFVAIGTCDGVTVLDLLANGRTRQVPTPGHSLSFHPDGKLLAIASTTCSILNLDIGRVRTRLSAVLRAEFSPDGRWLLASTPSGVSIVSPDEPKLHRTIDDSGGKPLAWCPDGRFFVVGNRLYELPACRPIGKLPVSKVGALRFSRDGSVLALTVREGDVLLFRVPEVVPAETLPHPGAVHALAISPDAALIATGQGADRDTKEPTPLCLWDARTGVTTQKSTHPGPVTAVEFSPDGAHLLVGTMSGRVRVLQTASLPEVISD